MSKQSKFLEGIMIGTLLGGILGLLFAPESGEETRKKIKSKTQNKEALMENAKGQTEDLIEKTKDAIELGFAKVKKLIEENKENQSSQFSSN
tara:strand:- start:33 stop:308 length:276 start_codon:yes stop_codon:yes gene_type:complete